MYVLAALGSVTAIDIVSFAPPAFSVFVAAAATGSITFETPQPVRATAAPRRASARAILRPLMPLL